MFRTRTQRLRVMLQHIWCIVAKRGRARVELLGLANEDLEHGWYDILSSLGRVCLLTSCRSSVGAAWTNGAARAATTVKVVNFMMMR